MSEVTARDPDMENALRLSDELEKASIKAIGLKKKNLTDDQLGLYQKRRLLEVEAWVGVIIEHDNRIRSEAVKAERERIRSSLMGKIESMKMISTSIPGPEYEFRMTRWAMDEVLTFISTENTTEATTH